MNPSIRVPSDIILDQQQLSSPPEQIEKIQKDLKQ
jgi:hypothetical protein